MRNPESWRIIGLAVAAILLTACGNTERVGEQLTTEERRKAEVGKLFGDDTFTFGPGSRREEAGTQRSGIGVNSYLWRASLDTLAFLPLASADPFGGVIISDWYAPPESPNERFKVSVFILGRELRSDGIRAAVHKQLLDDGRGWTDASVGDGTATKIEDAILTRARELRVATAN